METRRWSYINSFCFSFSDNIKLMPTPLSY